MVAATPSKPPRSYAQDADLDGPLIDWRQKGHRIEYLGTEDVDGTLAIKLRVVRKDGDIQYVFLDSDSALEIRITTVHKVRGSEEIGETDLGGYQQVAGVWIPFFHRELFPSPLAGSVSSSPALGRFES